jgi:hypothetical protein
MNANERRRVVLVRLLHGIIALFLLASVGLVYYAGITGRVGTVTYLAILVLVVEGIVVFLNKGNCPFDTVHRWAGDDRTLLELFFPPRVAKMGIPFLAILTGIGLLLLAFQVFGRS